MVFFSNVVSVLLISISVSNIADVTAPPPPPPQDQYPQPPYASPLPPHPGLYAPAPPGSPPFAPDPYPQQQHDRPPSPSGPPPTSQGPYSQPPYPSPLPHGLPVPPPVPPPGPQAPSPEEIIEKIDAEVQKWQQIITDARERKISKSIFKIVIITDDLNVYRQWHHNLQIDLYTAQSEGTAKIDERVAKFYEEYGEEPQPRGPTADALKRFHDSFDTLMKEIPVKGKGVIDEMMKLRSTPIENNGVTINYLEKDIDVKDYKFTQLQIAHMMVPNKCSKNMLLDICKKVKKKYVTQRIKDENERLIEVAESVHNYINLIPISESAKKWLHGNVQYTLYVHQGRWAATDMCRGEIALPDLRSVEVTFNDVLVRYVKQGHNVKALADRMIRDFEIIANSVHGFGLIVGYEIARRINSYKPYRITHQTQPVRRGKIILQSTAALKGNTSLKIAIQRTAYYYLKAILPRANDDVLKGKAVEIGGTCETQILQQKTRAVSEMEKFVSDCDPEKRWQYLNGAFLYRLWDDIDKFITMSRTGPVGSAGGSGNREIGNGNMNMGGMAPMQTSPTGYPPTTPIGDRRDMGNGEAMGQQQYLPPSHPPTPTGGSRDIGNPNDMNQMQSSPIQMDYVTPPIEPSQMGGIEINSERIPLPVVYDDKGVPIMPTTQYQKAPTILDGTRLMVYPENGSYARTASGSKFVETGLNPPAPGPEPAPTAPTRR